MAPDRRFGLPHPLDAEPSEDFSSPRKPGLWESFKRALGSAPPEASRSAEPARAPVPEPPVPRAQPTPRPPANPIGAAPPAPADRIPPETVVDPPAGDLLSDVPFLEDLPFEAPPPRPAPLESLRETAALSGAEEPGVASKLFEPGATLPADPAEPPLEAPRLARGLASFSRDNAEREKKFAHLLRDQPEGGGKNPVSPSRRR